MNAVEALHRFLPHALAPERAARFISLTSTAKGQNKFLGSLCHDFERALRPGVWGGRTVPRESRCYAFSTLTRFGAEFATVADAYEKLISWESWLIVLADGSGGIYRPEARWDAQLETVA